MKNSHSEEHGSVWLYEPRKAYQSAAIIASQSLKGSMNKRVHGFDGAKSVNGRKRHLAIATLGLLLVIVVGAADVAEREGARKLFAKLAQGFERLKLIWADAGQQRLCSLGEEELCLAT